MEGGSPAGPGQGQLEGRGLNTQGCVNPAPLYTAGHGKGPGGGESRGLGLGAVEEKNMGVSGPSAVLW